MPGTAFPSERTLRNSLGGPDQQEGNERLRSEDEGERTHRLPGVQRGNDTAQSAAGDQGGGLGARDADEREQQRVSHP